MQKTTRTIVSAVLISRDQKILLGKVREGGVYPDCWHLPGGGVDKGEEKLGALTREIKEELGLNISTYRTTLLSDTDTGEAEKTDKNTGEIFVVTMHFNVYQINLTENAEDVSISLNDDLKEYIWVSFSELKKYKHTPPSEKLFKKLGWV